MTTESPTTSRPRWRLGWFHVVALLVIAALLAWHFGLFTRTPRLAMVTSGEGPYWDAVIAGADHAARIYDVKVDVIRVPTKADVQSGKIRQLLAMSYDGIAVSPINPIAQAAVLADAAKATTLVTFDSDSPVAGRLCFVGTDNYAAGRSCGQLVRDALPNGGKVVIFLGNPDKENTQRKHPAPPPGGHR